MVLREITHAHSLDELMMMRIEIVTFVIVK